MADFWGEKEERMGCSWVKSSSNPPVSLCIAKVISSLFKYYNMRGLHLFIKWEDMNLCDCTVGEGEKWRWR